MLAVFHLAGSKVMFSSRMAWYIRRLFGQFGWPAMAGAGMLLVSGIVYFFFVQPLGDEVKSLALRAEVARISRNAAPVSAQQRMKNELALFYQTFPNIADYPKSLERLNEAAVSQGVTLEQGEYRLEYGGADRLARYEIVLPVKSNYISLRKFISRALSDISGLALNSVTFQKQKASDTYLEAQIKMTLFLLER